MRAAGWRVSLLAAFLAALLATLLVGPAPPASADGAAASGAGVAGTRFPLHVDGQRLVDAGGRDFRIIGDAPWTLIVALTLDEARDYLAARKAQGFNTILVELIEPKFSGPRDRAGDLPFPKGRPFEDPSPAYFAHARAVIDLALKDDFLVLLAPAYLGYNCGSEGYCRQMLATPDATLQAYGKYVASQFADVPNLIWVEGGDVDARRYGAMGKVEAVYRGIHAVLPDALHTAHCARNFSAVDCYDQAWLDVNSTYSDCEQTPAKIRLDRQRVADRPSIYIEGRYEEEQSTLLCVRSQLWWSMLGGSVGHVFGNKRIWRFEPDWRQALDTPGARAMTAASTLFARLAQAGQRPVAVDLADSPIEVERLATAWDRLADADPSPSLALAAITGSEQEIPVAESPDATIAYLPYPATIRYRGKFQALCWIDPRTGAVKPADRDEALESPDDRDWLFVAEKTGSLCGATHQGTNSQSP